MSTLSPWVYPRWQPNEYVEAKCWVYQQRCCLEKPATHLGVLVVDAWLPLQLRLPVAMHSRWQQQTIQILRSLTALHMADGDSVLGSWIWSGSDQLLQAFGKSTVDGEFLSVSAPFKYTINFFKWMCQKCAFPVLQHKAEEELVFPG